MAHSIAKHLARRCRVIVCGVGGRMGTIRTELVYANPRFELCGVCDVNLEAAEKMADTYTYTYFYQHVDRQRMIDFHLLIPTKFHVPVQTQAFWDFASVLSQFGGTKTEKKIPQFYDVGWTGHCCTYQLSRKLHQKAAKNGLGVFVEKPIAESPEEIEELYHVCEQHQVPLCYGFQRRFDKSYAQAAQHLQQGSIEKVSNANIFFGDSPGPPLKFLLEGGNIFYDLSCHDVDFIRWALNDEIESVYACGTSSREELAECNIQDNATMMMQTAKESIIILTMSRRAAYGYDQRCEIFADQGKVNVGNAFQTKTIISDKHGDHSSRLKNIFDTRFHDAFTNEINAFADTLMGNAPWPVKKEDVIRVQQVAAAAKKILETNQIVYIGIQ